MIASRAIGRKAQGDAQKKKGGRIVKRRCERVDR